MNTITEAQVRAVLGNSPILTDEDYANIVGSANADHDEGAEWLPYYKAALCVLVQAFGQMSGLVEKLTDNGVIPLSFKTEVEARRLDIVAIGRLHLLPCGIGPDESRHTVKETDAIIREAIRGGFS